MKIVHKAISFICITMLLLCMTACGTSKTLEPSSNETQSSSENESMQKKRDNGNRRDRAAGCKKQSIRRE